jgi:hypothetical protein
MNRIRTNLAKSAKGKFGLALALLATLGVSAFAVAASTKNSMSVSVSPASQSFTEGQAKTVSYIFTVANANGSITLQTAGIPASVTATWSTPSGSGPPGQLKKCTGSCYVLPSGSSKATLTLQIPYDLAAGSYPMTLTATTPDNASATATATLISAVAPKFTISGDSSGPMTLDGPARSINVSIANPYDHTLTVSNLSVSVASVSKSACDPGNFTITQVPSGTTYTVAANSTLIVTSPKPKISWPNDPLHPQNACIGALVTFGYLANGTA